MNYQILGDGNYSTSLFQKDVNRFQMISVRKWRIRTGNLGIAKSNKQCNVMFRAKIEIYCKL